FRRVLNRFDLVVTELDRRIGMLDRLPDLADDRAAAERALVAGFDMGFQPLDLVDRRFDAGAQSFSDVEEIAPDLGAGRSGAGSDRAKLANQCLQIMGDPTA